MGGELAKISQQSSWVHHLCSHHSTVGVHGLGLGVLQSTRWLEEEEHSHETLVKSVY